MDGKTFKYYYYAKASTRLVISPNFKITTIGLFNHKLRFSLKRWETENMFCIKNQQKLYLPSTQNGNWWEVVQNANECEIFISKLHH